MRYLPALTALLAAAPCALAKSKAKVNTSSPVRHLARSPRAAVAARQDSGSSTGEDGEFCTTDGDGDDWYCTDPGTACCIGSEVWQCAPIDAGECCTTGHYCDEGSHCYIDSVGDQLCLTPEEVEDQEGDGIEESEDSEWASSGSGSGSSGSGSGSGSTSTNGDDSGDTTTSSGSGDGDKGKDGEDSSGGADTGAASGDGKEKDGSDSGAGMVSAGNVMAGVVAVVAVGALALV